MGPPFLRRADDAGTMFAQLRLMTKPDLFSALRKTEPTWLIVRNSF